MYFVQTIKQPKQYIVSLRAPSISMRQRFSSAPAAAASQARENLRLLQTEVKAFSVVTFFYSSLMR